MHNQPETHEPVAQLVAAGHLQATASGIIVPGHAHVFLHPEPRGGYSLASEDGDLLGVFCADRAADALRILFEQTVPALWTALSAAGGTPGVFPNPKNP